MCLLAATAWSRARGGRDGVFVRTAVRPCLPGSLHALLCLPLALAQRSGTPPVLSVVNGVQGHGFEAAMGKRFPPKEWGGEVERGSTGTVGTEMGPTCDPRQGGGEPGLN